MTRRVQHTQAVGFAYTNHISRLQTLIHMGDFPDGRRKGEHLSTRRRAQGLIATDVVVMLMGIENAPQGPAPLTSGLQAQFPVERVYGECFTRARTGEKVVVVAPTVARPEAFDQEFHEHGVYLAPS